MFDAVASWIAANRDTETLSSDLVGALVATLGKKDDLAMETRSGTQALTCTRACARTAVCSSAALVAAALVALVLAPASSPGRVHYELTIALTPTKHDSGISAVDLASGAHRQLEGFRGAAQHRWSEDGRRGHRLDPAST